MNNMENYKDYVIVDIEKVEEITKGYNYDIFPATLYKDQFPITCNYRDDL